ncbi:MAG: hypothetical protein AAB336_01385 [Acidobacteriota bacterium]
MEGILYIIIFIGVISAGIAKYARTRELSSKLGREVEDHELVSLNSWIEAERKADEKKGIKPEKPLIQRREQSVVKNKAKNEPIEVSEPQTESPDNCPKCGAALSKEISRCQFCGTHSSREALKEHTSIFLHDLEKDFESIIPSYHEHLRFGCVFIPLLALTGTLIAYFLMPDSRASYAFLFGVPLLSLIVAYIWMNMVDVILNKKEGVIFNHFIEPKIRDFMSRNQLEPLEFLSLAKQNLLKDNKLLKHIYQHF